ncbi:TetR/AcrR family transcriptional regulator [Aquihabitans sp. G128]|uniref:TetR/AcrR family transcriptional regulator n=1 Tax=Aquihabitans sp. G128 TaxID=2849779 RepID=UPI001C210EAD|nr:TetR/AcrR family transcriptional regulator [Aquihabitans sp. G128]QXC62145.1 TetR/AcrR family transcriptional regulator [Aquihabitans sp. G128]
MPTTEEQLLHAASECIRQQGIRRTTIEEVARVAGVSRGTVYRYWPTKEALVAAAFSRATAEFVQESVAVIDAEHTLIDRIVANANLVRTYVPDQALLGLDETEPETVALLLTRDLPLLMVPWIELWVPYLEAARDAGEVRADLDVRRAAEWLLRVLVTTVTTPAVTVDLDDPDDLAAFLRAHLVAGLA